MRLIKWGVIVEALGLCLIVLFGLWGVSRIVVDTGDNWAWLKMFAPVLFFGTICVLTLIASVLVLGTGFPRNKHSLRDGELLHILHIVWDYSEIRHEPGWGPVDHLLVVATRHDIKKSTDGPWIIYLLPESSVLGVQDDDLVVVHKTRENVFVLKRVDDLLP